MQVENGLTTQPHIMIDYCIALYILTRLISPSIRAEDLKVRSPTAAFQVCIFCLSVAVPVHDVCTRQ